MFTDPPGQLGRDREQGHRPVAQALRDPGALRLNVPDAAGSLPGLLGTLFSFPWDVTYSTDDGVLALVLEV